MSTLMAGRGGPGRQSDPLQAPSLLNCSPRRKSAGLTKPVLAPGHFLSGTKGETHVVSTLTVLRDCAPRWNWPRLRSFRCTCQRQGHLRRAQDNRPRQRRHRRYERGQSGRQQQLSTSSTRTKMAPSRPENCMGDCPGVSSRQRTRIAMARSAKTNTLPPWRRDSRQRT